MADGQANACSGRSVGAGISAVGVGLDGAQFNRRLSAQTWSAGQAGVASNPHLQEYLTAFRIGPNPGPGYCPQSGCRPPGLYGQRVTITGDEVGEDDLLILPWDRSIWELGFAVAVAYNPRAQRYLVAWEQQVSDAQGTAFEIFGQRLTNDGALVGPPHVQISIPDGLERGASRPLIVTRAGHGFLVVSKRPSGGIFARAVGARGHGPTGVTDDPDG